MSFVAEGDVSQFDESKKSAMVAVIASAAGVDVSQVRCNVAAASVLVTATIVATSTSQASSAHNALSSNMGTASSANNLFSSAGADVVVVTAATTYLAKLIEDPHMTDGRGGLFDFKGKDLVVYNLLTTKNTTVNGLFKHTDFRTDHRLIHGSARS